MKKYFALFAVVWVGACVAEESDPDGGVTDPGSGGASNTPTIACGEGTKACNDTCVRNDEPAFGCASTSCEPCALAHADAGCGDGACTVATCEAGFGSCDGDPLDGCETDLSADPEHCGACGEACPAEQPFCDEGACSAMCAPGEVRCGGACVDTMSDAGHCGGCDAACPTGPNAAPACEQGACVAACVSDDWGDCDSDAATGCEADLAEDPFNCGSCGEHCGSGNCNAGTCACSPIGGSCSSPGTIDCCSGVCILGSCCIPSGHYTSSPSSCCSGQVYAFPNNDMCK